VHAHVASMKVKECGAEYRVCSEPSRPLPMGAVSYDFLSSHMEQMAAGHWPNMARLAFTHGVLDLQAVAVLLAAELSKLRNLDLSHSEVVPQCLVLICIGHWPLLEHLNLSHTRMRADSKYIMSHLQMVTSW